MPSALVADDSPLLRNMIASVLRSADIDVVASVCDSDEARCGMLDLRPDIAILDIRMPPHNRLDGLHAAIEVRQQVPDQAILLLSQYTEVEYVDKLLGRDAGGLGYLLKDRIGGAGHFICAVRRVMHGGCAIDPEVVELLMHPISQSPVSMLTDAERSILALVVEGHPSDAIGAALALSPNTVEANVASIFGTFGLVDEIKPERRAVAVLGYLRSH